jgi:hypothetical protein
MTDYFIQGIDNEAAQVLFAVLLLMLFAISIAALLFFLLLVRAVWRWLTRATWNDVIVNTEHRALGRANVCRQGELGANGGK